MVSLSLMVNLQTFANPHMTNGPDIGAVSETGGEAASGRKFLHLIASNQLNTITINRLLCNRMAHVALATRPAHASHLRCRARSAATRIDFE